ncbi:hypothetical protein GCM10012275_03250 [Longimycelium tulufanense]|uniref:Uncharacterized protein n=1 Tax=Longimycelium tulufanense TaxID=907463 RepID=A0A8J3C9P6_9PSEU|nr:hypothetical protein [Longimycelium tulufanense]GGM35338.1 hypothetical protein GCM10012275_03250 [Longimycelium tulufanense]
MGPGVAFSQADRCAHHSYRPLLVQETADAIVAESLGRLEAVWCPFGGGWHVWAPALEKRSITSL